MKFKRHILMTSAAAALAMSAMGTQAFAQTASGTQAASSDSTTIVVTGIRKSLQSSLKQKRNADRVEEVITAEDVGKFPDKNVADSLSRATGVNVVTGSANAGGFGENERISIRGTDPNLNLTLMDGHNMATGDWFVLDQANAGRSFNYSMLPSEVVGTIEVIKSSSADLPEGGVGGTVDVHVRKPLDLPSNTFSMSAQALYATRPNKVTPNVSGMWSWKNDDHTLGVLVGAFYERRDFRRDGQEVLGYSDTPNFAGSGKTVSVPSLIGSAFFLQQRTREGGNLVVQWKPSDTFEAELSGLYTYLKADNSNHNFMMWGSQLAGVTPNAGYTTTTGPDGKTYLTSATWTQAEVGSGKSIVQDDIFRKAHSSSYDINLDATWRVLPDLTAKGQVGFTGGMGETDDSAAWETYWTGVGASFQLGKVTPVQYTGLPSDPTSAAYLNNKFSWSWGGKTTSPDRELYAKIDFNYELPNGGLFKNILFGARTTDHYRAVLDYAYSWAGNGAYSGTSGVNLGTVVGGKTPSNYAENLQGIPNNYSFATAGNVYNYLDTHNGGRNFGFYGQASFGVREKTQAYYAMTKFGDDKWFGDAGVRAVHTDSDAIQYTLTTAGGISSVFAGTDPNGKQQYYVSETIKHSYWDVLPSVNVNYKASDDLVFRGAVSKVMTRPPYAQLAGYFYLVDANFTGGSGGNPDLRPFRATQYNLSAEWYYSPDALLSVGLFDLQIENFIKQHSFTGFYTDVQNPQGHTFQMTGPENGGSAKDSGVELNWQQPIGAGFGFIANTTLSSGKTSDGAAIDGNSKLTYNLTGYYEQGPISTRLAYQFRSKFKSGDDRGTPMWQDDYATLDGTFAYTVNSHLSLTLDAQNLLDRKLTYFVGSPNIPRAYYDYGQTFYAGFRLKY